MHAHDTSNDEENNCESEEAVEPDTLHTLNHSSGVASDCEDIRDFLLELEVSNSTVEISSGENASLH